MRYFEQELKMNREFVVSEEQVEELRDMCHELELALMAASPLDFASSEQAVYLETDLRVVRWCIGQYLRGRLWNPAMEPALDVAAQQGDNVQPGC
jgi:hypothetical protein